MKTRTKLAFLIAGMVLIPILVTLAAVAVRVSRIEREESIPVAATAIGWMHESRDELLGGEYPHDAIEELPNEVDAAAFTPDGQVIASSLPEFEPDSPVDFDFLFQYVTEESYRRNILLQAFGDDPEGGAEGSILLSYPRVPAARVSRDKAIELFLFMGALVVVFAGGMGYLILRGIRSNLLTLEQATARIAAGDLDFELRPRGNDEFASLTSAFDGMRAALKEEYARRSRFIMGVSHDLRTPISLIEGYAEALQDGVVEDEEQRRRYLGVIREKADRLNALVEQLIGFTRLQTSEWRATFAPVPVGPCLRELGSRYRMDCELYGREFTWSVDVPAEVAVEMDEQMATRVFENIISNSIQHTGDGGRIRLEARLDGERVRVEISDDGAGMGEEEAARVFEPFYRGSHSRREGGFGLGLANAKAVAEAHGWEISFTSPEGSGACVVVSMPFSSVNRT